MKYNNMFIDGEGVLHEGTPLNAENMNKGNWRDDTSISFASRDSDKTVDSDDKVTKIYTDKHGETWVVPPAATIQNYKLSSGQTALENLNSYRNETTSSIESLNNSFNNYRAETTNNIESLRNDLGSFKDEITRSVKSLQGLLSSLKDPTTGKLFDLNDPATGQKNFLQYILDNLYAIMAEPLTVEEFENLSISASAYDSKQITAAGFDVRGRYLFGK